MVGYKPYKFHKDEDITIIKYNSPETAEDIIFPELTICVNNPFLTEKLKDKNEFVNLSLYLKYLKGKEGKDGFSEAYKNIDFDHVTVDLFDYFQTLDITWKNFTHTTCSNKNGCPYAIFKNNYNGFLIQDFFKCLALEANAKYIKFILNLRLTFNAMLKNILMNFKAAAVVFNYPQQITTSARFKSIWIIPNETSVEDRFEIFPIETVRRRNKRNDPCFLEWMHYDDLAFQNYLEKVGCRAPYQKQVQQLPICNTPEEMRKCDFP